MKMTYVAPTIEAVKLNVQLMSASGGGSDGGFDGEWDTFSKGWEGGIVDTNKEE